MKALEFKSKIKDNKISIPSNLRHKLKANKDVRVILLVEESEVYDDMIFQQLVQEQFLEGYSDSDSIYDDKE
jgi:DNA-binding transcriptional regulator/RsmH inhibitor MraZ